jgi:hypothetical protein
LMSSVTPFRPASVPDSSAIAAPIVISRTSNTFPVFADG